MPFVNSFIEFFFNSFSLIIHHFHCPWKIKKTKKFFFFICEFNGCVNAKEETFSTIWPQLLNAFGDNASQLSEYIRNAMNVAHTSLLRRQTMEGWQNDGYEIRNNTTTVMHINWYYDVKINIIFFLLMLELIKIKELSP